MSLSLKQKTIQSGSWVLFGHLFSQLLRLGSNLILTRLLVPEMFGVMAIVYVIQTGLALFSDVGLKQSIVQSERGEDSAFLNTAWTIHVVRGFIIFIITLLISFTLYELGQRGYLSPDNVYGNPQLPIVLMVISSTAIIAGFDSIYLKVLNRKLAMSKVVTIDLISQVVSTLFMLVWAWFQRDIWALVAGSIVGAAVKMFLSHFLDLGGRCRIGWDSKAANEMLHFGKWIFLSSILGFLLSQGDRVILGGLINSEVLGVYTIAYFLAFALHGLLSKLINAVLFPALSDVVRNNPQNIQSVYYKLRLRVDLIVMPLAGLFFAMGSNIVELLYSDSYHDAGWMFEVLSLSLISIGFILADQLFISYGKPKYTVVSVVIMVIALYISLPLSYAHYGIYGAVLTIALIPMLKIIISMVLMKRYFFLNFYREIMVFPLVPVGYLIGRELNLIIVGWQGLG